MAASDSAADRDRRAADARVGDRPVFTDDPDRQREEYGGIKWGSAFFGWLTAMGLVALIASVLSAIGLGIGLAENPQQIDGQTAQAWSIAGAIVLLIVIFVAYYAGGYVAGRMARFDGLKQGLAVWLWALFAAIVVAILGVLIGAQFNLLSSLNAFPRIPMGADELTVTGIITALVLAAASLGGALLGGKAGTHYHRKVDRAGMVPNR